MKIHIPYINVILGTIRDRHSIVKSGFKVGFDPIKKTNFGSRPTMVNSFQILDMLLTTCDKFRSYIYVNSDNQTLT